MEPLRKEPVEVVSISDQDASFSRNVQLGGDSEYSGARVLYMYMHI